LKDVADKVYCFNDKINHTGLFNGVMTAQCGEEPLCAYGSCNLGSMNLSKYVFNPFEKECYFDFDLFSRDVQLATRLMDNINLINKERQPLPENKEVIEQTNAIGLGLTGLADMLIKMNLKYDTDEAINFVGEVIKSLKENTVKSSIDLAVERGVFPLLLSNKEEKIQFMNNEHFDFLEEEKNKEYYNKFVNYGIRHVQFNTIAPNGSLSIIAQCSSGIEPIFCCEYERTTITGDEKNKQTYIVKHPLVREYEQLTGKSYKDNPNFITAEEIDWKKRVKLQATAQKYISESISSTVNLPKDTTKEVISNIYMTAWKMGLKGITIYRAGSRDGVLNKIEQKENYIALPIKRNVKFPDSTNAKMRVIRSENKKWYVTYTIDEETKLPNSLFVNTNSSETSIVTNEVMLSFKELAKKYIDEEFIEQLENKTAHQSNVVKTARFLSLLLRHRVPMLEIIKAIESSNIPVNSFAYRIKGLLAEFIEGVLDGDCPECNSKMRYEGGCCVCVNCGYSKCG
jgi:ribonucleoside-diphosphate reductase alpha chain